MGVPDPSRRLQRPPAFRGIPGRPRDRPQYPLRSAGEDGRRRDPRAPRRPRRAAAVIYSLTPKGEGLLPVVLALRQWGEDWGYGNMDIALADRRDGKPVRKMCVLSHDGRELEARRPHLDRARRGAGATQDRRRVSLFDREDVIAQRAGVVQRVVRHLAVRRGAEPAQRRRGESHGGTSAIIPGPGHQQIALNCAMSSGQSATINGSWSSPRDNGRSPCAASASAHARRVQLSGTMSR